MFAARLDSQTFDGTRLAEPATLEVPWLMHPGDDLSWARPDFDDSQWTLFDPHKDIKTYLGASQPDFIWYRLHVKVSPDQSDLALRVTTLSRAFEVYANGERIMTLGRFEPFLPYAWNAPLLQHIPQPMMASGSLVIAMRVHISRQEWGSQGPGYSAGNLALGPFGTLQQLDWLDGIGQHSLVWLDHLLLIGLGIVALVLFVAQRRQAEYLWIAALGLFTLVESIEPMLGLFYNFPLHWEIANDLLRVATPYLWASLYFSFVHQRIGWRWTSFLVFAGVLNAFSGVAWNFAALPPAVQLFSNLPFVVLLAIVIPIMMAIYWWRGNREAGILLIPAMLFSLYIYAEIYFGTLFQLTSHKDVALRGLNLIERFPAGPFVISMDNVSGILSTIALALILLLRSSTMIRKQTLLESELAAAQQVQQVLVPEEVDSFPGFFVESVYEPAQQVGGDFFQVLPADRGGLLVVVGDVAGKGLPAAMMVSVLVGAIRGVSEYTVDPAELLSSLNDRLIGRTSGGFSTALAAHITQDGWVTIANAGHLSPYLDGKEVELAGALPLGIVSGNPYSTKQFYLAHGSRLTFYSDGVVEAQNAAGELFGFDRAKEISTEPAADIVEAAKKFGQEDDITVVAVTREEAFATAA